MNWWEGHRALVGKGPSLKVDLFVTGNVEEYISVTGNVEEDLPYLIKSFIKLLFII